MTTRNRLEYFWHMIIARGMRVKILSNKFLALISRRLPDRQEIIKVFYFVIVLVHSWAFLAFFYEAPAYLMRLDTSDVIGVLAYIQVFAFIESVIVVIGIVLLAFLTPRNFILVNFVVRGSILLFLSPLVLSLYRLRLIFIFVLKLNVTHLTYLNIIIAVLFIFAILDLFAFERRHPRFSAVIQKLLERMSVLAGLFVIFDTFFFFVIIYRLLRLAL